MEITNLTSVMHIAATWAHVFLSLAAAILLFIKHHMPKERSQWYIVTFFSLSSLAAIIEVLVILTTQRTLDNVHLFDGRLVLTGAITLSFLVIYYLDLLRPEWLNLKRYLALFTPGIIAIVIVVVTYILGQFTHIHSVSDIHTAWGNIDFLARFVLSISPLLYIFWIMSLCMRGHSGYRCPRIMMRGTMLISAALCITFFLSRGFNFFVAYMLHEAIFIALGVLLIYVEHYERLHIPLEKVLRYYVPKSLPKTTDVTISQVAERLQALLEDSAVWKDPDLTGDKLAQLAATNRTYLQQAAKELGFAGLVEMIHHRRIDYVCQQLRQDPSASIQDLFFEAGYRSRTTAWRNFSDIVGFTPTEFVERNSTPKKQGNPIR
jgi:AraC-like DNA-binding protein